MVTIYITIYTDILQWELLLGRHCSQGKQRGVSRSHQSIKGYDAKLTGKVDCQLTANKFIRILHSLMVNFIVITPKSSEPPPHSSA